MIAASNTEDLSTFSGLLPSVDERTNITRGGCGNNRPNDGQNRNNDGYRWGRLSPTKIVERPSARSEGRIIHNKVHGDKSLNKIRGDSS